MDSLPLETRLALKAYGDEQLKDGATGLLTHTSWQMKPERYGFGNGHLDVGESEIRMFLRTRSDALAAATVMPVPIDTYPCNVAYQLQLYCIGVKLGVSLEGEVFRASDEDIEAVLKKIPGVPPGATAPAWLDLVARVYRHYEERHRSSTKYNKEHLCTIVGDEKYKKEFICTIVGKRPAPVATASSLADRVKMRKRTGK